MTVWKHVVATFFGLITSAHAVSSPDHLLNQIGHDTVITPVQRETRSQRKQTLCLALGIYHEARSQGFDGQRAVAHVILNRIRASGRTICQTLWETGEFPWTKRSIHKLVPHELASWETVQWHALEVQHTSDNTHGATMFYNARLCKPRWADKGTVTLRIGDHVFIRI